MNWRQQQVDQTYAFARPHMTRFRVALDIGCDVFEIAGHLAREFQHTHCFDFRDKTAQMHKHVEDMTRVTFHHTALGDTESVKYTKPGVGRIKADEPRRRSTLPVKVRTLDSYGLRDVDFIKLDVEGYETRVLQGGMDTIQRFSPAILCEINRGDFSARQLLESIGYRCVDVYYKEGTPHDYMFIR